MYNITAEELLFILFIMCLILPATGGLLILWLTSKTIDKKIEILKNISENDAD